jgi:hypothetical protein
MNIINIKYNKNFKENILLKDELKFLFIYTYQDKRIYDIGLPMHNKEDNICYFITGFNIIARLQYIIYKEIDNLIEIDEMKIYIDKIKQNKCLDYEESKKFNKYLLIQTLIEVHSDDILTKLYGKTKNIKFIIQEFIEQRLSEYAFSESSLNKNFEQKFIEYLEFKSNELEKKYNVYFKTKYNGYLDKGYEYKVIGKKTDNVTDKTEFDELEDNNIIYLKKFSDINRLFYFINIKISKVIHDHFYDLNGIKPNITNANTYFKYINFIINERVYILLKNIGKFFCKITDKDNNILKFKLKPQSENPNISETYKDFYTVFNNPTDIESLENNFTEIYLELRDLLKLTYYKIEDILKITDFTQISPDVTCDNNKLRKVDRNIKFLKENLAVNASISGSESSIVIDTLGSESSIVIDTLITILDTKFIETRNDFLFLDKPYYIYNQANKDIKGIDIPKFLNNKYKIKKDDKTYRLCSVSFVCTGHSVSAICYGHNCDDKKFMRINESEGLDIDLNKKDGKYNLGKLCKFNEYYIDKMVYESVSHIDELKKEIDEFIKKNKLQINPTPIINGGFLQKYKIMFPNNII